MLAAMDSHQIFDCSGGKKPFLLLAGHHSRFDLPFLDYIVNPDHEWQVCIGVPYGNHLWQVGDSEAQNGSFSIAITKAKQELYKLKPHDNKNFSSTDIIPLINMAWPKSFGRIEPCSRAISEREWNPLNYALLIKPELLKTKPINKDTGVKPQQENVGNQQVASDIMKGIYTTNGAAGDIVDQLVIQELKNRGRTDAIRKRRQQESVRNDKIKNLAAGGGKLTSGMLGANEHYSLDIDVRNAMAKYYEKKEQDEKEKNDKKFVQVQRRNEKYMLAKQKYRNNQTLNRLELTALLSYHRKKGDPPLAKTINDLRQQWERAKVQMEPDLQNASIVAAVFGAPNIDFDADKRNNGIEVGEFGTLCTEPELLDSFCESALQVAHEAAASTVTCKCTCISSDTSNGTCDFCSSLKKNIENTTSVEI